MTVRYVDSMFEAIPLKIVFPQYARNAFIDARYAHIVPLDAIDVTIR